MDNTEKPSNNKVIAAVALFFILGFIINTLLNYNQTSTLEQKLPVAEETLKLTKEMSNTLSNQSTKLDEISNKLKILEDNSKNNKGNTGK